MTGMVDLASGALVTVGAVFFLAGTVGLLRFPDLYCRLHALTKADNLGLGLVALGLALQTGGVAPRLQLLLIWLLALVAAATVCHLLARKTIQEAGPGAPGGPGGPGGPGHPPQPEPLVRSRP